MARRRPVVIDVGQSSEENALARARYGWELGRFGCQDWHPFLTWDWPHVSEVVSGVDLLDRVATDYAAAGIGLPIGGYVGHPYLLPGETVTERASG